MRNSNKNVNSNNNVSSIKTGTENLNTITSERNVNGLSEGDGGSINTCINCNKTFSSKQSLKLHIKTSNCEKNGEAVDKICKYCDKKFSSKQMLKYHLDTCTERKIHLLNEKHQEDIEILKQEIERLKNQLNK